MNAHHNRSTILKRLIDRNHLEDNVDRRGFLECMAWAGTGVIWTFAGGVPTSKLLGADTKASKDDFTFVQISDSHIGFNRPANPDVTGTMKAAIDKINALSKQPQFLIHTRDLPHQSKPEELAVTHYGPKSTRR